MKVALLFFFVYFFLAPVGAVYADELFSDQAAAGPIQRSMNRAAKCCLSWLNPEQNFLPTGGYEAAHDLGRWWDAMLRYEAATGIRIPEKEEAAMLQNLRSLTDNSAALLTSDVCNPHNLRESMLAYTALVTRSACGTICLRSKPWKRCP